MIYADYNPLKNSIDVTTFENYILRIDCNKAEDGLKTTPCSQNSLNALAIEHVIPIRFGFVCQSDTTSKHKGNLPVFIFQ